MIEMLVALVVIGALLAILVPAYIGYSVRAQDSSAKANLRQAIPSVEAYKADNGSYAGMTVASLRTYDSGLSTGLSIYGTPTTTYCITDTEGTRTWSVAGPGASAASYKRNGTCT